MTELSSLLNGSCTDKATPLNDADSAALLALLPGWALAGTTLERRFAFKNYYDTMAFVNALAWISHQQDHHPELVVNYKDCVVRYTTHSASAVLTNNDFVCAAKASALVADRAAA